MSQALAVWRPAVRLAGSGMEGAVEFAVVQLGVGLLVVLLSSVSVFRPRLSWRWRLFGTRWMYAEPDRLEPSKAGLTAIWAGGMIGLVLGGAVLVTGVRATVVALTVETKPGTPGAQAQLLDRFIRESASSTGRSPRDRDLAQQAVREVRHAYAVDQCVKGSPSSYVEIDRCVQLQETSMLVEYISLAGDYTATGRITIRPPDPADFERQVVCLTVATEPSGSGDIDVGACPER